VEQVELEGKKIKVSAVGFGCAGLMQSPSRKERMAVLGSAVDSGITHFDIARMYGLGRAETELGAFLRTVDRGSVTIATKFGIDAADAARLFSRFQAPARALLQKSTTLRRAAKRHQAAFTTARTYDASTAARSLDQSLSALGLDYVDVFFLHAPRPGDTVAHDELQHFFEHARQQGKIRAWGVSQDEGFSADFGRAVTPAGVSQLRSDLLNPSRHPADIAFGVLNRSLSTLSSALAADARLAKLWRDALEMDPLAPGALLKMILGCSTKAMGCRAILYSSTKPRRVAEAASAVSSPLDAETLGRFQALVEDFRHRSKP
jgi:aryl-alcohol dehydrogenase-like predicted oxidoreductase